MYKTLILLISFINIIYSDSIKTDIYTFVNNIDSLQKMMPNEKQKKFENEKFLNDVDEINKLIQLILNRQNSTIKKSFLGLSKKQGHEYEWSDGAQMKSNKKISFSEIKDMGWTDRVGNNFFRSMYHSVPNKPSGEGILLDFQTSFDELKEFYGLEKIIDLNITKDKIDDYRLIVFSPAISFSHKIDTYTFDYNINMEFICDTTVAEFWSSKLDINIAEKTGYMGYRLRTREDNLFNAMVKGRKSFIGELKLNIPDFINNIPLGVFKNGDREFSFLTTSYFEMFFNQELLELINTNSHRIDDRKSYKIYKDYGPMFKCKPCGDIGKIKLSEDNKKMYWGFIDNDLSKVSEYSNAAYYDKKITYKNYPRSPFFDGLFFRLEREYWFYWTEVERRLINRYDFLSYDNINKKLIIKID